MPTICCQGTDGASVRPAGDTRAAASPISWRQWTTARWYIRSLSRSSRPRPRENVSASTAASNMCRMRVRSSDAGSRGIERPRLGDHFFTEILREVCRRAEVDVTAEHVAELHEHPAEIE